MHPSQQDKQNVATALSMLASGVFAFCFFLAILAAL